MTHNTAARPSLSAWQATKIVTPQELCTMDQNAMKAINGDDGGSWSPSSPISIQGASGIGMAAPLTVMTGGKLAFTGTGKVSGAATVDTDNGFSIGTMSWGTNGEPTLGSSTVSGPLKTSNTSGVRFTSADGSADILQVGGYVQSSAPLQIRDHEIYSKGSTPVTLNGRFSRGANYSEPLRPMFVNVTSGTVNVTSGVNIVIVNVTPTAALILTLPLAAVDGGAVQDGSVVRVVLRNRIASAGAALQVSNYGSQPFFEAKYQATYSEGVLAADFMYTTTGGWMLIGMDKLQG